MAVNVSWVSSVVGKEGPGADVQLLSSFSAIDSLMRWVRQVLNTPQLR